MDGEAAASGSSHDHPKTGPTDGGVASGGYHMETGTIDGGAVTDGVASAGSSHADHMTNSTMDGEAFTTDWPDSSLDLEGADFELTDEEYKELVESTRPFHGSVARIIDYDKKKRVVGTGTAFLVSRRGTRSLFLTAQHNFGTLRKGEVRVIRLLDAEDDYTVEKVIKSDKDRDLLLFSVQNVVGDRRCLEFSTEKVEQFDNVVILGYSAPTLDLEEGITELVCVKDPSILPGKVICDPYRSESDVVYEKILNSCGATKGVSGSPLFKNSKIIAVHLGADKSWRDAVSSNTVHEVFREWLKVGEDKKYTIKDLLEMFHDKEINEEKLKKRRRH